MARAAALYAPKAHLAELAHLGMDPPAMTAS